MQIQQFNTFFNQEMEGIYSVDETNIIRHWLLEDRLGIPLSQLRKMGNQIIEDAFLDQLQKDLEALKSMVPIQYVLKKAHFYNLEFIVNNNVLIPRPETEELVDWIVKSIDNQDVKVLDIGTGSGCIAISLKKNLLHANVSAIDISESALSIAKQNAAKLNASINLIQLNILDTIKCNALPIFDCIVSNPPYIPISEISNMQEQVVSQEPHLALFVPNEKPLVFYNAIAEFARVHLSANGKVFVEINQQLHQETAAIFEAQFNKVEVKKDINDNYRMLMATQPR